MKMVLINISNEAWSSLCMIKDMDIVHECLKLLFDYHVDTENY